MNEIEVVRVTLRLFAWNLQKTFRK